jgi:hypothetical protein
MRQYSRPFMGIKLNHGGREAFRFLGKPNSSTHPQYVHIVGPFKTMRAAKYMAAHAYVGTSIPAAEYASEMHDKAA